MWKKQKLATIKIGNIFKHRIHSEEQEHLFICDKKGVYHLLQVTELEKKEENIQIENTWFERVPHSIPLTLNNNNTETIVEKYTTEEELEIQGELETFFFSVLENNLITELEEFQPAFIEEIGVWVTDKLLHSVKYKVEQSPTSTWENVGELISLDEDFKINDYQTLQDFLKEYNGDSEPSLEHEIDFYHLTYEDELNDMIADTISNAMMMTLEELYEEFEIFRNWAYHVTEHSTDESNVLNHLLWYVLDTPKSDSLFEKLENTLRNFVIDIPLSDLYESGKENIKKLNRFPSSVPVHLQEKSKELLDKITKISGKKIITIVNEHGSQTVNWESSEEFLFDVQGLIIHGMMFDGVIAIRQFTPLQLQIEGETDVPIQRVYGVRLGDDDWTGISPEELEWAFGTDSKTGLPMKKEIGVQYYPFS